MVASRIIAVLDRPPPLLPLPPLPALGCDAAPPKEDAPLVPATQHSQAQAY